MRLPLVTKERIGYTPQKTASLLCGVVSVSFSVVWENRRFESLGLRPGDSPFCGVRVEEGITGPSEHSTHPEIECGRWDELNRWEIRGPDFPIPLVIRSWTLMI